MPTTRPRLTITETDELADTLDAAAAAGPRSAPAASCCCDSSGRGARYSIASAPVEALIAAAEQPLACGPITLAEVLVGPARAGRLRDAGGAITDLGVAEVPLGDDAAARLGALRAETALNMPDGCVLAAEGGQAEAVVTFDDRLARAAQHRRLRIV